MPKTYTDDVAPALPSSIDGPFQIVDPSDSASWIKIDPATAQISTAGSARPTRVITAEYNRPYGLAYSQYIGPHLAAHYVNAGSSAGFLLNPFCIPEKMDVTEPCYVRILVSPIADATVNGQVIRFELAQTSVTQAGSLDYTIFTYDWNVPDDWTTSDYNVVLIDNGNTRSYDPDTFANREIVGFRIRRVGTDAEDTFNKGVKVADFLQIEYTAKKY